MDSAVSRQPSTEGRLAGQELPLTSREQRLWFLQETFPEILVFPLLTGFHWRGPLEPRRLRRALAALQ